MIIVTILFFSGYCYAKYEETRNLLVKANIAVPVLEVEGTETTKISEVNNVGYYDFTVKNYNEKQISDVSQNYNIEIVSNNDEAITYELYQDNEQIILNGNKTDNIYIKGEEQQTHTYRLKISYDSNKNNSERDIIEDVQIKVHSEQNMI